MSFKDYYLNTSKYADKQRLYSAFTSVWARRFGVWSGSVNQRSLAALTPAVKKDFKVLLQAKGFSSQAIDSLFRAFAAYARAYRG